MLFRQVTRPARLVRPDVGSARPGDRSSLPRATLDIDLLIPTDALAQVSEIAQGLGYSLAAEPMAFADNGDGTMHTPHLQKSPALQSLEVWQEP